MKNFFWILILSCLPGTSFARFGGGAGDGGGGHGFSSTPAEVRAYVGNGDHLSPFRKDWMGLHGYLDSWLVLSPANAPNPVIKKILAELQRAYLKGDSNKAYEAIENMPLAVSDACYDHDGLLSDGATTIGQLGAPICLNAASLARYPTGELRSELLALIYHEWTHQLGFGETEAVEMQNYIKHLLPIAMSMFDEPNGEIPIRVGGSRTMVAQDGTKLTIYCTTEEAWSKGTKGGNIFKSTAVTLFVGQSMKVRGPWAGDLPVACSDLPELDCTVKPAHPENDQDCHGAWVFYGDKNENKDCVGTEYGHPAEYPDFEAMRTAKICK